MKLVALIASLSATSKKRYKINNLMSKSTCLSRLSLEIKRQAQKKPNKINAYRLVALVAPTGNAGADKRRPPGVSMGNLSRIEKPGNRKAICKPDKLSDDGRHFSPMISRYLIGLFLGKTAGDVC
ncbi:hypothetical protein CO657_19870 [Rhizobium acidisoli]|uniref:Uncharacterized protein n=1 Tax=Rhizobium acidisoli TaxID=1538158 RepID=A0AAE5U0J1_9HYPH|nr:hypothetical protein [Rhizobium acidisoli]KPH09099.1 hypothetical protein AOG23_07410 [Rhizobium acidisoli]QAS80190.1 hypothetical protein CO657_19870 [Rhizobium acidisoli]